MHSILFQLGPFTVTSFGFMLMLGFLAGLASWTWQGRKRGWDFNFCSDLLVWVAISGILGARIAYVAAEWEQFADRPIEMLFLHKGGLVFYGGVMGAGFALLLFSRLRHISFAELLDFVIPSVPLAHVFGRIGCFLNGCCHGAVADGTLAVKYPFESQVWYRHLYEYPDQFVRFQRTSLPVHPVQLYEAFFNLLLYILLLRVVRRNPARGVVTGLYFVLYAIGRFCFEFLRGDERPYWGMMSTAQISGLALFAAGAIILVSIKMRKPAHGMDS